MLSVKKDLTFKIILTTKTDYIFQCVESQSMNQFTRKRGFILIEFLGALVLVGILGGILIQYQLMCAGSVFDLKRRLLAVDSARVILEHITLKNDFNKKIENLPDFLKYSFKKKEEFVPFGKNRKKLFLVSVKVWWPDFKGNICGYELSTYCEK